MEPPPALSLPCCRKLWLLLLRARKRLTFCPSSAGPTDLSRWMQLLPREARQKPLLSLLIPGSHDAGSYGLTTRFGFAPDQSDLEREWWFRFFPRIALSISKRWTKTQSADVGQQLANGVRYFDLRGAPKVYQSHEDLVNDGDRSAKLFFVHALYGPSLLGFVSKVKDFLDSHAGELVILHFQHFHAVNQRIESQFLADLTATLGRKICPFSLQHASSSLDQLTSQGYQVILVFPSTTSVTSDQVWPSDFLLNPWANTTDLKTLNRFLNEKVASRPGDRFFVTQGVLTPDHTYIRDHVASSLRKSLAIPCNKFISAWLDVQKTDRDTLGPNIIMTDFVEWNSYELPRKVILKNFDV